MRDQTMEEVGRDVLSGYIEDLVILVDSANDGKLAPWMTAKMRCEKMADIIQTVCNAIASRPGPGQQALRATAGQGMDLEPFENGEFTQAEVDTFESAIDEMEAEHISAAKPDPFFTEKRSPDGNGNAIAPFSSPHDPFEEALKMVRPPS